ncbi:MAG: PDDEXK nuclease domain-containing protein [Saprospiraceae bacterium]
MLQADNQYIHWLSQLKDNIKKSQLKAAVAVNTELISMYWYLGKEISEKQENAVWGSGFIDQLSKDLKVEFPEVSGFSPKNLRYCRSFYMFWQQAVAKLQLNENQIHIFKIPWGHNIQILQKVKNEQDAIFYIEQTLENNWSRAVLEYQIETKLHQRQGKMVSNFKNTLPDVHGDLAQQLFKDPYHFEFLSLSNTAKEADLEQKLIENITQFLLELGKGFAYMGRQFKIKAGEKEYRTDLLFYHTKIHCYIIIELKMADFKPEYAGKMNFYLNVIDEAIKSPDDLPTLGIILCKSKDDIEVEFSIYNINKPIGVSKFLYTDELPIDLKNSLPSKSEWKRMLKNN